MAIEVKAIRIEEEAADNVVEVVITGKLAKEDYETFVPEIDRLAEKHGKLRMLIELVDFHGWTLSAAWEDTKFGLRHFNDIERLALVGDQKWEKGMALFCKAFTTAKVKYFDISALDKARSWVRETN